MQTLYRIDPLLTIKESTYIRLITRNPKLFSGKKLSVQRGQGLKAEFFMRLIWLAVEHPNLFKKNLPVFIVAGSWDAIAYYSRLGWTVSIPITDSQDYDLLVENTDNNILKVQVKTSRYLTEGGTYQVSLKTCGGNKSGQTIKKMDKNYIDLF